LFKSVVKYQIVLQGRAASNTQSISITNASEWIYPNFAAVNQITTTKLSFFLFYLNCLRNFPFLRKSWLRIPV